MWILKYPARLFMFTVMAAFWALHTLIFGDDDNDGPPTAVAPA